MLDKEELSGVKVSRRRFLAVSTAAAVGAVVAGVVVGAVGGYLAGQAAAPAKTVTATETRTVTTTLAPGAPTTITQTVTKPITTTITETKTITQATTTTPPRVIKIGLTIPITGQYAAVTGPTEAKMVSTFEAMINERGGIYVKEYKQRLPVKFIYYDDKSDVATVEKLYTKLITEDKVDLLVGPFTAAPSMAASTVAEKYKVPYIDAQAAEIPLFTRGYKYIVGSMNTVNTWFKFYLDMVKADGRPKTFAVVMWDDPFGMECGSFAAVYGEKRCGLKLVLSEKIAHGTMDFTPIIAKLQAADPDIVIASEITGTSQALLWKQMNEKGYRPRDFHGIFAVTEGFIKTAGREIMEGVTGDVKWLPDLPFEGTIVTKEFFQELQERTPYNHFENTVITDLVCALEIACVAVQVAGTLDKEKINEVLHTAQFGTIWGPWRAVVPPPDEDPILAAPYEPPRGKYFGVAPWYPVQYQRGKWVTLWPPELKTGEYKYPAFD
jgi:branched-chain amino acid transport system substrate-binding protein